MSPITTHVLNTALGKPAAGIAVLVEFSKGSDLWDELARGVTDRDGRVGEFNPKLEPLVPGLYRLRFLTAAYFTATATHGFYPEIDVIVQIDDGAQHYHIPLLLSPYGYTTYRGS
jgi:5-hydroxyisourate hydrolase